MRRSQCGQFMARGLPHVRAGASTCPAAACRAIERGGCVRGGICGNSSRVLAYYLHHFSPFIIEFSNGRGLRWYGLAYVVGFLLGYWLYKWLAERLYTDMKPEMVSDFITWAAMLGVMLGGRLGWLIFYGWDKVR